MPDGQIRLLLNASPILDCLMFGFTASLMMWQDLPLVQVAIVLVVLFGAALVALGPAE